MATGKQEIVIGVATRREFGKIIIRNVGLTFCGGEILICITITCLFGRCNIIVLVKFAL